MQKKSGKAAFVHYAPVDIVFLPFFMCITVISLSFDSCFIGFISLLLLRVHVQSNLNCIPCMNTATQMVLNE